MDTAPEVNPPKVESWIQRKAKEKSVLWWLGLYSFLESSPILLPPTDIFLAAAILLNRARTITFTVFTTLTSVLGGIAAYFFAAFFFSAVAEPMIAFFALEEEVAAASIILNEYAFVATLIGALTPIPYTPVAFAAGFLHVNVVTFILATFIGRAVRYSAVAAIVYVFGKLILPRIPQVSARTSLFVVLGVVVVTILYFLAHLVV